MCEGNGECLSECKCRHLKGTSDCHCYNYVHGHLKNNNTRYCIIDSKCKFRCVLKDCKNFIYCKDEYPEYLLINNQCNNCDAFKVKFINKMDICFVCSDNKYLIETECNHSFCLDCLLNINLDKTEPDDNPCPICNKNIDFTD
jgi:hypothetical protein